MNVILRLFSLTGVFVGFGEGVCDDGVVSYWQASHELKLPRSTITSESHSE